MFANEKVNKEARSQGGYVIQMGGSSSYLPNDMYEYYDEPMSCINDGITN